ncbi:MAG: thiopurine S-methyltransferase [bacterium]|nr:thiopurine S-methyltransferase [bacterium]
MDVNFWLQRWERNEIGFHEKVTNPLLVEYFKELALDKYSRIFLPLCGKTLDIAWLLSEGYRVIGVELSKTAIEQLFAELGVEPNISKAGNVDHYSAKNIDIFVGDFFELSSKALGIVDAIFDRAALVALPEEIRQKYKTHLLEITSAAPQLLFSYEYDQSLMDGPPFSVSSDEVKRYYMNNYKLNLLKKINISGSIKGKCAAIESVWLLTNS